MYRGKEGHLLSYSAERVLSSVHYHLLGNHNWSIWSVVITFVAIVGVYLDYRYVTTFEITGWSWETTIFATDINVVELNTSHH